MIRNLESSTSNGHTLSLLVVACAVTWLFSPTIEPTAFASHEGIYTYARTQQVAKELYAGRFPQSFPDAVYGGGFAFPRYYPPFTLLLSAVLVFVTGSVTMAVNFSFYLSVLLSGLSMYGLVHGISKDRMLAVAASLLYVSLPYRFVDIYVRGALAEAWTFVWYPLIVLGLWRSMTRRSLPWYLPFAIAGLALTHNITAVYFLAWCGAFTLLGMAIRGWKVGLLPALAFVLGVGLGLWFLIPQQVYLSAVWAGDPSFMWTNADHVREHAVYPLQLLYSSASKWFGDSTALGSPDRMSFELGVGQLLFVPAIIFIGVQFGWRKHRQRSLVLGSLLPAVVVGWIGCILFMLYPGPILSVLPRQFSFIQFPWRMLTVSGFLAPLGIAITAAWLGRRRTWVPVVVLIASVLVVVFVPAFERTPKSSDEWTEKEVMAPGFILPTGFIGFTVLGEYLPRDADVVAAQQKRLDPNLFSKPRILSGDGATIRDWERDGPSFEVTVSSPGGAVVRIPLFFYDFYFAVTESGERLPITSTNGMLTVQVPAGETRFSVGQELTPISKLGFGLSGLALIATVGAVASFRGRRRPVVKLGGDRRTETGESDRRFGQEGDPA